MQTIDGGTADLDGFLGGLVAAWIVFGVGTAQVEREPPRTKAACHERRQGFPYFGGLLVGIVHAGADRDVDPELRREVLLPFVEKRRRR